MVARAALLLLVLALAGPVMGQEGAAPEVQTEAPALPVGPTPEMSEALPRLPEAAPAQPEAAPVHASVAAMNAQMLELVRIAHPVVQAVMLVLALAAFAALTILVQKSVEFALANRRLTRVMAGLSGVGQSGAVQSGAGQSGPVDLAALDSLHGARSGPAAAMVRAARAELALAEADPALLPGAGSRTRAALQRIELSAAQSLRLGTGLLASIGALAPFVGLFGTVFGIMNSFLAIAETKTTNLAVVAPGIAEALLATAIGLAAAIPAVLFYNLFARRLANHRRRLGDLATAIEVLQSRALDRLAARTGVRG